MRQRPISSIVFVVVELCAAFVFFSVVLHHVYTFDFKPLAALCAPILILFFGFASLLYNRGRALPGGEAQVLSLCAAERTMQATVWYVFGIVLGTTIYGLITFFGVHFDPGNPALSGLWLLFFIIPYALMQIGILCFMRAAWLISPQFLRKVRLSELRRRVQQ